VAGFIAQARQRLRDDPARREAPRNLLEAMLVDAGTPGSEVGDTDIAGNVLNMLLAGEDTTAHSLAWMIYLLSRHPDALQRANDEVRKVLQPGQMPIAEQLAGFDFVEACMHETMRLKPVAPFIAVQAARDTTLADVRVPAGTLVWCVMRHDSLDERHFADAAAFQPQRWLGDAAGSSSSAKRISMPFGAGARVCPGRYLAMQEMKLVMAMLLGSFDIVGVDTPDGGEAQESMAVTMAPVGLKLRLRSRG
jgi:cytochrome P450